MNLARRIAAIARNGTRRIYRRTQRLAKRLGGAARRAAKRFDKTIARPLDRWVSQVRRRVEKRVRPVIARRRRRAAATRSRFQEFVEKRYRRSARGVDKYFRGRRKAKRIRRAHQRRVWRARAWRARRRYPAVAAVIAAIWRLFKPLVELQRRRRRGRAEVHGIHLKEEGRTYEQSYKGPWGRRRYYRDLERGNRKKRVMFERYVRAGERVDLSRPFVYVPLHFQPERTTSSLGGVFADQYLLVDLVARSLPEGWSVYVKEHPSQFYPHFAGERSRHADLYGELAAIPRVKLASLAVSTFDLIDNSKAVATVTGTAGWEAVVRGRPALVVGSPWYRACHGVFVVPTVGAMREALAQTDQGFEIDHRKVRLYVKVLTERCARASLGYNLPDEVELAMPLDQSVAAIADLFERYWDHLQTLDAPAGRLTGPEVVANGRTLARETVA